MPSLSRRPRPMGLPITLVLMICEDLTFNKRNPEKDLETLESIASQQYHNIASLTSTLIGFCGPKAVNKNLRDIKAYCKEHQPEWFNAYFANESENNTPAS